MSDFIHLHCHSEYSMLDGAIRLEDLCKKAKEFGMRSCAVTDHGNMHAAAQLQTLCNKYELKPIFGCEVYTCPDCTQKNEHNRRRYHLILLARNMEGYHNLVKIVTKGYLDGFYVKPRVDWNILKDHAEGLTCFSACLQGEIPQAIRGGNMDRARELISNYSKLYKGHFYLEIQSNGLQAQRDLNDALKNFSHEMGVPLVATNDCHYLTRDDAEAQDILMCIGMGKTKDDTSLRLGTNEIYFKSPEEMEAQPEFQDSKSALTNAAEIAEECDVTLTFGKHFFPVYTLEDKSKSLEEEFCDLARKGLERRFAEHPQQESLDKEKYRERLEYELGVILKMGFASYFLIVQEFINWAKDHGIPTGPGRGSAAGSVVVWALRITNLDPLPYNLLFERFLNIERVSLPDIDVDFCERRRGEVIQHMADKYGADSVSQIAAFGKLKARAVIKDVGRVLGMSFKERTVIANFVPLDDPKIHIADVVERSEELRKMRDSDPTGKIKKLLLISEKLEGVTRQASMHAAGLVVSDKPMVEYLPLFRGKHDEQVTQFDGPMVEQTGLVKFDFLGLKTMTLIQDVLDNIKREGRTPPDLDTLPLDDKKTYELYSRGDTDGVFQVEGSGMRQYLRMLRPTCFEDLIAMLALYRPGPLNSGMVDEFIKRKHGEVKVTYPHPSLQECLRDTYGVIVYQEQVMQIAQIIASYTLGGADLLRRAMGKKKAEAMAKERVNFVAGAQKNGIGKAKADEIFDLMEKFAAYGFNKSHSAAYAQISYHTAYLKTHYPREFMAALLSSEMQNKDKIMKYLSWCKDMGLEVLSPSVNHSEFFFSVYEGKILFGLGGIKNVGEEAFNEIKAAREKGKRPFTSLLDFCKRVCLRKVTKRVLENLILGGAFDETGATRQALFTCLEPVLDKAQALAKKQGPAAQISLLGACFVKVQEKETHGVGLNIQGATLDEYDEREKSKKEKEVLGFYLSSHPLRPYAKEIERLQSVQLERYQGANPAPSGGSAVIVTSLRRLTTKAKGESMAIAEVEDQTGRAEVAFFPKSFSPEIGELLEQEGVALWLEAKLDTKEAEEEDDEDDEAPAAKVVKLIGSSVVPLEQKMGECPNKVLFFIPPKKLNENSIEILRVILERHTKPASEYQQTMVGIEVVARHEMFDYGFELPNFKVYPSVEFWAEIENWQNS